MWVQDAVYSKHSGGTVPIGNFAPDLGSQVCDQFSLATGLVGLFSLGAVATSMMCLFSRWTLVASLQDQTASDPRISGSVGQREAMGFRNSPKSLWTTKKECFRTGYTGTLSLSNKLLLNAYYMLGLLEDRREDVGLAFVELRSLPAVTNVLTPASNNCQAAGLVCIHP